MIREVKVPPSRWQPVVASGRQHTKAKLATEGRMGTFSFIGFLENRMTELNHTYCPNRAIGAPILVVLGYCKA